MPGTIITLKDDNNQDLYPQTVAEAVYRNDGNPIDRVIERLESELHNLSGKYYGAFTSSTNLPEGDVSGYAFVGTSDPLSIYNFDGVSWADSGVTVSGIVGPQGIGFDSISSPTVADGTLTITLTNGDTITLDLNHTHSEYPKYQLLASQAAYDAITTKESDKLYLIPESSS